MIERDVTESHLDAIEAQLHLTLAQVESCRQHLARLQAQQQPRTEVVRLELPERCGDFDESKCMLQTDEGKVKNLGGTWFCRGCRAEDRES